MRATTTKVVFLAHPLMLVYTPVLWACSFRIGFGGLEAFCNDDGTRTFLAVSVGEGKQELCRAIRAVDRAFRLFGLPTFHKVPGYSRPAVPRSISRTRQYLHHPERDLCYPD